MQLPPGERRRAMRLRKQRSMICCLLPTSSLNLIFAYPSPGVELRLASGKSCGENSSSPAQAQKFTRMSHEMENLYGRSSARCGNKFSFFSRQNLRGNSFADCN